ncbi:MAG: SpoIIE family protein phosphatase [bacterium]|nr:SpoIIE family protein phosphatase [bacterium]
MFIAILFALTAASYFIFPSWAFTLLFWTMVIAAFIRLLFLVKRRLFWKIRNRLIFSGLFLVATPIIFITIFFYLIGTIVIAQYGGIIINNMMEERLNKIDPISSTLIKYNDAEIMTQFAQRFIADSRWAFSTIFWEKQGDTFVPFFKYPESLSAEKVIVKNFRGYFMVDDKLYMGVLKTGDNVAALLANEINQQYLDGFSSISDFNVEYKIPDSYVPPDDPALKLTGNSSAIIDGKAAAGGDEEERGVALALFTYKYYDYNTIVNSAPLERDGDFILAMDYGKIYRKIVTAMASPAHSGTKQLILILFIPFMSLIIISFLIGFRMVRVLTRSINQLTKGTQRIRNGDFSFRIKTRSGDQMQYLAESFNEMAAGIDRLLIDEKEKQRLEEELRIARSIQLKLLPPESFRTDEFEIAGVNIPAAEIAGDYFDYFYKKDRYLSLLVADVSGKGASAAFYMAELKGVINHLNREIMSPCDVISECHYSLKQSFDRVTFITMNMAQFRIAEKKFVLARAGHTQALYYSTKEKDCLELFPEGIAIGLINFSRDKLKEIEMQYHSGDILFLFSDGLSEIMNDEDEMLGIKNIKQVLCENHDLTAEEIKHKMLDFSIRFSDSGINRDDLTFIVLKVK